MVARVLALALALSLALLLTVASGSSPGSALRRLRALGHHEESRWRRRLVGEVEDPTRAWPLRELQPRELQPRVVGGGNVERGRFRWTGSVQRKVRGKWQHMCGAALIAEQWVLTAAHCFRRYNPKRVVLGVVDLKSRGGKRLQRGVAKLIIHEQFDKNSLKHDLALIKLRRKVSATKIQPIRVASGSSAVDAAMRAPGSFMTVAGWGSLEQGGEGSRFMQSVDVPVVSRAECTAKDAYKKSAIFNKISLCAGFKAGARDSCEGDSGGPLFHEDAVDESPTLVGVVSWGEGCAQAFKYGVYVNIAEYSKWINNAVGKKVVKFDDDSLEEDDDRARAPP